MATRKAKAPPQSKAGPVGKDVMPPKNKVGRPRAKHSDPNYVQMSVYIYKDVRTKVKMRLFETDGEFSELVESLLRQWLDKPGPKKR